MGGSNKTDLFELAKGDQAALMAQSFLSPHNPLNTAIIATKFLLTQAEERKKNSLIRHFLLAADISQTFHEFMQGYEQQTKVNETAALIIAAKTIDKKAKIYKTARSALLKEFIKQNPEHKDMTPQEFNSLFQPHFINALIDQGLEEEQAKEQTRAIMQHLEQNPEQSATILSTLGDLQAEVDEGVPFVYNFQEKLGALPQFADKDLSFSDIASLSDADLKLLNLIAPKLYNISEDVMNTAAFFKQYIEQNGVGCLRITEFGRRKRSCHTIFHRLH